MTPETLHALYELVFFFCGVLSGLAFWYPVLRGY